MDHDLQLLLTQQLHEIKAQSLWKEEWPLLSPQESRIRVKEGQVINFCANNYLGLANHPALIAAAKQTLDQFGFGTASVRFICGTMSLHLELEQAVSAFMGTEDTILYSSCYEANEGLFETILSEEDAIISDELNHASIIDGVRLCKAKRYRYQHADMNDLEAQLKASSASRLKLIATDGIFSMDGTLARLQEICQLAEKYHAIVMVDDSHATGFIGTSGRGTPEHCQVMDRVDIITSTFGKALGGAAGGFTTGRKALIALLRQRSRPYLFSNALPPLICGATLKALELVRSSRDLRDRLEHNTASFRSGLKKAGLNIIEGFHPIVPIMFGDAKRAASVASRCFSKGIYVKGFSYPVVPHGKARIRCQVSAAHTQEQLDEAVAVFQSIGTGA